MKLGRFNGETNVAYPSMGWLAVGLVSYLALLQKSSAVCAMGQTNTLTLCHPVAGFRSALCVSSATGATRRRGTQTQVGRPREIANKNIRETRQAIAAIRE